MFVLPCCCLPEGELWTGARFLSQGFGSGVENGESTRSLEIHRDNRGTAEGRGQC